MWCCRYRPGVASLTAAVLGFCHAVGEFGVVLMIGGNIPGGNAGSFHPDYNHVERWSIWMPAVWRRSMLVFSFIALLLLSLGYGRGQQERHA